MNLRIIFVLLAIITGLSGMGLPARAARPLVRTAMAIHNLEMSIPTPLMPIVKSQTLGLDREPREIQKQILGYAATYVSLKSGQRGATAFAKWVDNCESRTGESDENPFCRIEQDRKLQRAARLATASIATEKSVTGSLFAESLVAGHPEAANGLGANVISAAIRALDVANQLNPVAELLAKTETCYAPALNYLVGYKLEERFPDPQIVDLARRVYHRGSNCAARGDYYGALASFRYGLMQIWKRDFLEIPALMAKVEASPEAANFHPRAKYWRFYSATQLGNNEGRRDAREALLKDHPLTFQNLAAGGDENDRPEPILKIRTPMIAYRSVVHPELNALLRGVEALIRIKSDLLAADVLERSVGDVALLEPEVRLYSAVLMNRIGYSLPKFKILSALFQDMPSYISADTMRLFFPIRYAEFLAKGRTALDPLLVLSLIRQESAFNKEARSQVGARGLMQVMPATARTVAAVRKNRLFDPKTNIHVGTKYLEQRLRQYDGDVELTLAAYNAGFARVDEWKRRYPTDNRMLFLDFIPFKETRDYVSSILRNYYWYVKLYDGPVYGLAMPAKVSAILSAKSGTRLPAVATEAVTLPGGRETTANAEKVDPKQ